MTQARELSKQDYRQIMDAAIALREVITGHMDAVAGTNDIDTEWHELHDLSKLASVIVQTAYRASCEAVDADAPIPFSIAHTWLAQCVANWAPLFTDPVTGELVPADEVPF